MQSIERTKQITNQLQPNNQQRNYANMPPSNNPELQMGQVFDVKDKVALVTGGGSGIGLMITQTLAVNGAKVYIVGRTEEKLEKVVEAHGQNIAGQVCFQKQYAYAIHTDSVLDHSHCRRCQHQGRCIVGCQRHLTENRMLTASQQDQEGD
jgi:FlaA1/EpsC-like NDP-sugar epimerase